MSSASSWAGSVADSFRCETSHHRNWTIYGLHARWCFYHVEEKIDQNSVQNQTFRSNFSSILILIEWFSRSSKTTRTRFDIQNIDKAFWGNLYAFYGLASISSWTKISSNENFQVPIFESFPMPILISFCRILLQNP